MKDNLEKFIIENKEEFNFREPDPSLWEKIEKNIQPRRVIRWRVILSRAAAVLIIFAASYLIHDALDKTNNGLIGDSKNKSSNQLVEIEEAEVYYSGLINEKLDEIEPFFAKDPSLKKAIKTDLNELDSIYNGLKQDLKENIATQEVMAAMIENYRLRISILEDILSEFKSQNNEKQDKINTYDL